MNDRSMPHSDMGDIIKRSLRDIWKTSHKKDRRLKAILSRLQIGHTDINHSYRMQRPKPPQPNCEICNTPLTGKHLIVEFTKLQSERNKWLRN